MCSGNQTWLAESSILEDFPSYKDVTCPGKGFGIALIMFWNGFSFGVMLQVQTRWPDATAVAVVCLLPHVWRHRIEV